MNRTDIVPLVAEKRQIHRYLEIGCDRDECFLNVDVPFKIGVDHSSGGTLRMSSDQFFSVWRGPPFDFVFIDGDHSWAQVLRDVNGAMKNLTPSGVLMLHDCLPPDLEHEDHNLCGTVWRAFVHLRQRPDLEAFCLDIDYGIGVVWRAKNSSPLILPKSLDALAYSDMVQWRELWMRPIPAIEVNGFLDGIP